MTLGKTGGTAKPPTAEIDARIGHDTWRWSFLAKIWRTFWQHFPSRNSLKNVGLEFDLERLTLFLVGLEKKASCLFLFFFVRSLFVFFSGCWAGLGWDFQEKNQSYAHRNWTYETGESGGLGKGKILISETMDLFLLFVRYLSQGPEFWCRI